MDKAVHIRAKHSCIECRHTEQEHTPHDRHYFVMGNNKIIIKEHFGYDGKPLESILETIILNAGKQPENRINTAKTE